MTDQMETSTSMNNNNSTTSTTTSTSSSSNDEVRNWLKETELEIYYNAFKKVGFTNRKSITALKKEHFTKMGLDNEIHQDILLNNAPATTIGLKLVVEPNSGLDISDSIITKESLFGIKSENCVPVLFSKETKLNKLFLSLYPNASGEISFSENGEWKLVDLTKEEVVIPSGTLVLFYCIGEGLDLGVGSAVMSHPFPNVASTSGPKITQRGIELVMTLGDKIEPPKCFYYKVKVTNPVNNASGFYDMLVDTGSRSCTPAAYERLGVEGGGKETTHAFNGVYTTICGIVQMELVAKAVPVGIDKTTGSKIWNYEELPEIFLRSLQNRNPTVISNIEGSIPHIGMNTLIEWGVAVHPFKGLISI